MFNLLLSLTNLYSQISHDCVTDGGYSWCDSSSECIRVWETPCKDHYTDCNDCLTKQREGLNLACPSNCDLTIPSPISVEPPMVIDPIPLPVTEPPMTPPIAIDPMPPIAIDPVSPIMDCPEVMCMMYCENGHQIDENGCQICDCNESNDDCPIIQPSCEGYSYICPKITEITHCGEGGINNHVTYQLSLVLKPNPAIYNIYAIYGDDNGNTITIPPSYQSTNGLNNNLGGYSDYLMDMIPDTRYDSWLTIGLTNGDPDNQVSSVGIDFKSWTETSGLSIDNGAVFLMNPENYNTITQGSEIVIAQLTLPKDTRANAIFNIQGKKTNTEGISGRYWTENNINFPLIPPVRVENSIPNNCISWYDGCNTCQVRNSQLGGCTRMMCFTEDTPRCLSYLTVGH